MSDPGQQAIQPQGGYKVDTDPDLNKIARWVAEIELYDRETANWRRRAKNIVKRYKDDRGANDTDLRVSSRFNAFWANVQTQMPSLYSRNPKPDIQRRFKDADPVGRVASDVLERCVSVFCDTDLFYATMRRAVKSYKLEGRGTTWERYVPHMEPAPELTDSVGAGNDADVPEQITYEETLTDYVHMADFGHNICRTPDEIWCGWRIVYMTRAALVKRFGEKGQTIPLDYVQKDLSGEKLNDGIAKASIYELWDKERRCAVWFHKTIPEALDLRPDPLKLDGFFPFPTPLLANLANDSCIPTPDYIESQDQYIELDDITSRIAALTKAVKVAGVYDASVEGLSRLLNEGVENKLIPVENYNLLTEKGGLENAISLLPLKDIVEALTSLYAARDKVKEDLHEISGIPDIARGQSDANETLGAQELKTSFAINRISDDQRDIQRFVREQIRLKVDIICGHFQLDTIKKISGVRLFTAQEKAEVSAFQKAMQAANVQPQGTAPQGGMVGSSAQPAPQPPPQPPQATYGLSQEQIEQMMTDPTWEEVESLIRNDAMRSFRIDIETDSTIKADEEADKASRIEYVKAIGEYMASALPAGQQHPELVPFLLEGLQFLSRAFPVGKNMESALNNAIAKLEKVAANPQPRPDPEMAKVQGQMQIEQAKLQGSIQMQQAKIQADAQAEATKAQAQAAVQQHLNQLEDQRRIHELQGEQELERFKASNDMQIKQAEIEQAERLAVMENERELTKARIQQETAIMVARINAAATDGAEEEKMAVEEDKALEAGSEEEDEDMKNTREIGEKLDALIAHLGKPQPDVAGAINNLAQAHKQTHEGISNLHKAVTSEKEIVRDPKTGKPSGVRIKPDPKELANQLRN